ncbi:MAG: ribosomal-processing cysteine protease Prp [Peptococcaceae bacterium]
MINAVIYKDIHDTLVGFEISGHADYAETGHDIVCAAVSILATTAVNSLEEQLAIKPVYSVKEPEGYLKCTLADLKGHDLEVAQIILKTLEIGLKSIEQEYDNFLKLQQRRWTIC